MKHIYLNLKRFDISPKNGGVNRLSAMSDWGKTIISQTQYALKVYSQSEVEFAMFFPEAHILSAAQEKTSDCPLQIGCQGVYHSDTAVGGNFGAFTTNRPANAAVELGCTSTLIGHCEERNDKASVLAEAGVTDTAAINRILNKEIKAAQKAGLNVVYCIGEKSEELENWQEVLGAQLAVGLDGVDMTKVVIAYEPIWSIGPGKTPADKPYIEKIGKFVREKTGGLDVVYGGGLKEDNAQMLASIDDISGGLIALTRFSGEIGFYPDEYLKIISLYLGN